MSGTPGIAELYRRDRVDGRVVVSGDTLDDRSVVLRDGSLFDGDIDAVLERWFNFWPSPLPIVE